MSVVGPCFEVDEASSSGKPTTAEGVIACGEGSHPVCVLQMNAARCVSGSSKTSAVEEVQLVSDIDLTTFKAQRVRVEGDAFPDYAAGPTHPISIRIKTTPQRE